VRRPARPGRRRRRALARGAAVLVALAGYLAVLMASGSGQGLEVLPHLVFAHAGHAPRLADDLPSDGHRLTTLRPDAEAAPVDDEKAFPEHRTIRVNAEPVPGLHRHGDRLVTHEHPPEPDRTPTAHLDQHRLPTPAVIPAPSEASRAPEIAYVEATTSIEPSVETPPPLGRG